ncbi:MAG: hypothetical protein HY914_07095 [Desulfomonile tiedjei]|nr:hypothetical protein [Desulfomonile tiedjei]
MNLCRPDELKSCAACCGLYNVPDATRPTLWKKLHRRTTLFRTTPRSLEEIDAYQRTVRSAEPEAPLEEIIHVCEFTGFLDPRRLIVGCQLHPSAPSNSEVDLRGLCHYGSMACKAFFCPAWAAIPGSYLGILVHALQDWHLYGLVITDVDFVISLFSLLEAQIGGTIDATRIEGREASAVFREMISWKDTWPLRGASTLRRNRYYFKPSAPAGELGSEDAMDRLLDCLAFTFDAPTNSGAAKAVVEETLKRFGRAYGRE